MTFLEKLSQNILTIDLSHLSEDDKNEIKKSIESLPTVKEYMDSSEGKKYIDEIVEESIVNYYKNR